MTAGSVTGRGYWMVSALSDRNDRAEYPSGGALTPVMGQETVVTGMNVPRWARATTLWDDGFSMGYEAALREARDAVDALPVYALRGRAVVEIDRLLGEQ